MRRTALTFVAATAAAGLAFAPIVDGGWSGPSAERLANPLSYLDGAEFDDLPGPGDLIHSVENIPGGHQGTLADHVDSAENFDPEPVFSHDVLSLSGSRHPSIPDKKNPEEGGIVRGGAEADLGTFVEFFSPTIVDETGQDVTIDIAIQGVNDMGALLWDVTDPTQVELLSIINCGYHQADVGAYQLEDGRWILAIGGDDVTAHEDCLSSQLSPYFDPTQPVAGTGDEVMAFFDVTDPTRPQALSSVATQETAIGGSHTIEMQPNLPYAYIVTALDPRIEVVDFSDPENPEIVATVDTPGNPHAFRISDDGTRGYSAGSLGGQTLSIHDMTDPTSSLLLGAATGPRNLYTHESLPAHDKSYVIVLDEGAFDPGYASGYCPGTGFWVYDLTVENAPVPLSYTVADADHQTAEGQACASHYGNISHNDELFTMAYYGAGVRVFDMTDPLNPDEVGHMMFPDSDVWTAKSYKDGEYVFVSDLNRGFEVYRWTGEGSLANVAPDEG